MGIAHDTALFDNSFFYLLTRSLFLAIIVLSVTYPQLDRVDVYTVENINEKL